MHDVVVVGGRAAGATLAARLGARDLRVLVVDKATFPSPPAVPSSGTVHPGTMKLLDELGVDEAAYADDHALMKGMQIDVGPWFSAVLEFPESFGRAYVYGVNRAQFDAVLWNHLARYPSVERREGFSVAELLRDAEGRVIGVAGPEGKAEARCVVGADGRFSVVARKVGAEIVEQDDVHTSTVYYADWKGVQVPPDFHRIWVHSTARGLNVIFFAMPGGCYSINTHARSDRVNVQGNPQRYYEETVRSIPGVARKLEEAQQVSAVVGVKKIGNGYRRGFGEGWALVGDAMHYKDPVDGQGIYDALVGSKLLDVAIAAWLGGQSWQAAMADYEKAVVAETRAMFLATTDRLERDLYAEPPVPVIRTVMRWMLTDPGFGEALIRFLSREIPAERWPFRFEMVGAIVRGASRDIRKVFA
jgi:2-polyprenyl-6-methoxyphenol hydroxylase-like FAD-dependent oxidoreductase